ncbi:HPr family phosphocarrier protein [Halopseudomonas nanhaiensis]|uniref:HPr family phosphocarrier protein n=1 Tax=Halopseudomonas nanhaiensis TaxID=2830842 RepID=UPI001CBCE50A|nr:HPr family phosphocarrier protein [Halopseudomonas nanhaiensis]UAW97836.1 HPr family phosphocarrier protein [Halopseudomonas nanhaiensis]
MPTRRIQIINKLGLHARAAAKFVGVANRYDCTVEIGTTEHSLVNGKSIMQVMMLAAAKGSDVCLRCEGPQADEAMAELCALIDDYFEEGE